MALPQSAADFLRGHTERLRSQAKKKRLVFPEGYDPRIVAAADKLVRDQLVTPVLVGKRPDSAPAGVAFVDPEQHDRLREYTRIYHERRRARGVTPSEAAAIARQPLYFAALMVAAGDADGFVGGAANSTTDTVRALLQCIGMEPRITTLSSIFFLCVCDRSFGANGVLGFSDAAIVVDPSAIELADMAIASAGSTRKLVGVEPHVALISFSTKGSAKHKLVDKVIEAYRIVRERAPELNVDGELQVDAAIVPDVGAFKARGSTVAGRANTLVFPDLNTANAAVKLVERLGGATAIGPFLQGLAKPANDLSRGATSEEIYAVSAITALQAESAA
jgi:phosphate acetyltransferase